MYWNGQGKERIKRLLSYVLVAMLASAVTWCVAYFVPDSKLEQLSAIIDRQYIGQSDQTQVEDAAANAMVEALGDRWSYYMSAEQYAYTQENQNNTYVGIGVTILKRHDGTGFDIISVDPEGPAAEAGVLEGDIVTHADGVFAGELTVDELRGLITGEKNTQVLLTLVRGEQTLEVSVTRKRIHTAAAKGQILEGNIGLVTIANFHTDTGAEIIEATRALVEAGVESLIFDVRNNPGGYVKEMVQALDYLLPEGVLFQSIDYNGKEKVERSDADCVQLPMAVLINGSSYSAAEFFAAALSEYDWAVTVGEQTCGKGYFQYTLPLMDGSAVNLSTGKYFTPKGISLTEAGGLTPDIPVTLTAEDLEDTQLRAAIQALQTQ